VAEPPACARPRACDFTRAIAQSCSRTCTYLGVQGRAFGPLSMRRTSLGSRSAAASRGDLARESLSPQGCERQVAAEHAHAFVSCAGPCQPWPPQSRRRAAPPLPPRRAHLRAPDCVSEHPWDRAFTSVTTRARTHKPRAGPGFAVAPSCLHLPRTARRVAFSPPSRESRGQARSLLCPCNPLESPESCCASG
jgi:hypothetical protein